MAVEAAISDSARGAKLEGGVLQPASPEAQADESEGTDFNVGLFAVMVVIVALVCVQNVWLARRSERDRSASEKKSKSGI